MSETEPKPSFWSTIPGVLKALGGLILAVATLLGALTAAGIFPGRDDASSDESQSDNPPLDGTYRVTVRLDDYLGTLAPGDELWGEADPVEGMEWPEQIWIFEEESGSWKVPERRQLDGFRQSDGTYLDTAIARCNGDPDTKVRRVFEPMSTEPLTGTLTINWRCGTTEEVNATFSVDETSSET
ncbi:MAG: hypothetical protein ACRDHI_13120 [Actinomycetota bacterium]